MNAAPYMKQFAHPIAIYPLRTCSCRTYQFRARVYRFNLLGVVVAAWKCLTFLDFSSTSSIFLLLLVAWPFAIICAITGTLFRDFSQLITIALQALWFVSPVFFSTDVFIDAGIGFLVYYNPIYYLTGIDPGPSPLWSVSHADQLRCNITINVRSLVYRYLPCCRILKRELSSTSDYDSRTSYPA